MPSRFQTGTVHLTNAIKEFYGGGGDDNDLHCVSKKVPTFKLSVTLSNLNRFSKFLHCWKAYEICYKTHMTLPTSP